MTHEKSPIKHSTIEELDAKFDFKISNVQVDQMIEQLKEIGDTVEKKLKELGVEERASLSQKLEELVLALDSAAGEREKVLKIIKQEPETIHTNSFSGGQYIPKLKDVISKIDEAIKDQIGGDERRSEQTVEEDENNEDEQSVSDDTDNIAIAEQEGEKPSEDIDVSIDKNEEAVAETYVHKPLKKVINGFKTAFEADPDNEELKSKVKEYIAEYLPKIQNRIEEFNNAPIPDLGNSEYKAAKNDLNLLKTLEQQINSKVETKPAAKPAKKPIALKTLEDLQGSEPLSSYDRILREIEKNTDRNAGIHFMHEHQTLFRNLSREIQDRKTKGEEASSVDAFIKEHQEKIRSLISVMNKEGWKNVEPLVRNLNDDMLELNKYKSDYKPEEPVPVPTPQPEQVPEGEPSDEIEFKPIDLTTALSGENVGIMQSNPDLFDRTMEMVSLYNNQLAVKSPMHVLEESLGKIEVLQQEFRNYKKEFKKRVKKTLDEEGAKKTKKKLRRDDFYDEDVDFETIGRVVARNQNPHPEKPQSNAEPLPVVSPTPQEKLDGANSTENEDSTEFRVFTMPLGVEAPLYSEIEKDTKFASWLNTITESIKREGIPKSEPLEDWYAEYKEAIPYIEKLNKIYEAIKESEGNSAIKTLTAKNKIDTLIYKIHDKGQAARDEINQAFASLEETQNNATQIESLKKSEALRIALGNERSKNPKRSLGTNEIGKILESRGLENARENIDELVTFLKDMENNYNFYSNSAEKMDNGMMYMYKKAKLSNTKEGRKVGFFTKALAKLTPLWSVDMDSSGLNNFSDRVKELRKLNLVDRKNGNREEVSRNIDRMRHLIQFVEGQKENLAKGDYSEFDDDEKELLKTFNAMMATFAKTKYNTLEAKQKAEEILSKSQGAKIQELEEMPTQSPTEILFDDDAEVKQFEREATRQVYQEALHELDKEANTLAKSPKKTMTDILGLSQRFEKISDVLKTVGNEEEDMLSLHKTALKIHEMTVKNIKENDSYNSLAPTFSSYDYIVSSEKVAKDVKIKYITDLLTALQKNRKIKTNTPVQNARLDAIIGKYKTVLTSIK